MGAALIGAKAPFRLVQDHSRSGRLEAATPALRKWLLSDAFGWCASRTFENLTGACGARTPLDVTKILIPNFIDDISNDSVPSLRSGLPFVSQ